MAGKRKSMAYKELEKEPNDEMEESTTAHYRVGLLSSLTYGWLSETMRLGYKRPLELSDLPYTVGQESTREIAETFEMTWSRELENSASNNRSPSLWTTVIKSIGFWNLVLVFFPAVLAGVCRMIQQVLLLYILTLMTAGIHNWNLWVCTGAFLIFLSMEIVAKNQYFYNTQYALRTRITSGMISLVYRKILSTRSTELADATAGHVINLISKDLQPLMKVASYLPVSVVGCVEFFAMGALLCSFVGWEALAGMLYLVLIGVCQSRTRSCISKFRKETQFMADKRNAIIKNIISGIRTVKMNTWESLFEKMVLAVRSKEIRTIHKKNIIYGALVAILNSFPATACFFSIAALWSAGINLTPAVVFTTSLIFKTLADSVVEAIIEGAYCISLFSATISRLESFLTNEDDHRSLLEKSFNLNDGDDFKNPGLTQVTHLDTPDERFKEPGIEMKNVSSYCKTKKDSSVFKLLNEISLLCRDRDLIAITGPAGSGKSSVLGAITGEVPVTSGQITVFGKIAYLPQDPWLFSGTVQENIVFGNVFDENKYLITIEACALIDDFEQLPFGDMTHVGESGVTLSGGQRARVSLARTVYSNADIFLLDSPLKAVDAKVGELIYEKCLCGLLSTRPRIHVTHDKKYLRNASVVLKMENGSIVSREKPLCEEGEDDVQDEDHVQQDVPEVKESLSNKEDSQPGVEVSHPEHTKTDKSPSGGKGIATADEDRETGSVSIRTYFRYFTAGASVFGVLFRFLLITIPGVLYLLLGFWLADMSRKPFYKQRESVNIYIYAGFQFGLFLSWLVGIYFMLHLTVNSARHLHNSMLGGILKAPALFFDTNPAGRILNRFSKDTEWMDETLPPHMIIIIFFIEDNFFSMLLICITDYWMILAFIFCLLPAFLLVRYYLRSSVEMRRLEAISASSVYSFVDETISGITVIRSFGREMQFKENLFRLQDKNNTAYMCAVGAGRWMAMRLEGIVILLLTLAMIIAVFTTDAATTGLTVLYARSLLLGIFRIAIHFTFIETGMIAVERCLSYSQLEPDPGYLLEAVPPEGWPEDGSIKFEDCSLVYYPDGPQVLKNLRLNIKPGEKIGITGRTGAGKSSLISALFRMPEPEGIIFISGIPINTMNIRESRKSMTIVPQKVFLFPGTLRQNLDPEEKHSDKVIWDMLETVSLSSMLQKTEEKLDYWIAENGSNLSGGEQQLICIARALLQDRKIVVFDEAMASMDFETDQCIQAILKKELENRTVLTIAHRLDSILGYDRIVVIDEGEIVEVGRPENLLQKEDGQFRRLYEHYRLSKS